MNAKSYAKIPPVPDEQFYALARLNLVQLFAPIPDASPRQQFAAQYGEEAPPYDPGWLPQLWFDSAADQLPDDAPYVIRFWAVDKGQLVRRNQTIPAKRARIPNLPGKYPWPAWSAPATTATRGIVTKIDPDTGDYTFTGELPLSANAVCTLEDAQLVVESMRKDGVPVLDPAEEIPPLPVAYHYPDQATDPRRAYNIGLRQYGKSAPNIIVPMVAGEKLAEMRRGGLGRPGKWVWQDGQYPVWQADDRTGEDQLANAIPAPQRDLSTTPEEKLIVQFGGYYLARMDKYGVSQSGSTDSGTQAILAQILEYSRQNAQTQQAILQFLQTIAAK